MEFDKSRVYTMLNADELKVGSKAIVADNLLDLKECVSKHKLPKIVKEVTSEDCEHRFLCDDDFHYSLAYLIAEPEEKKLKWTDLKVGDIITDGARRTAMVTEIDRIDCLHIYAGGKWYTNNELKTWKKVE